MWSDASLTDDEQDRSEHDRPSSPSREEQLQDRLDQLRAQRMELAAAQRDAETVRAAASADMEQALDNAEAQRKRLRYPVEQAERAAQAAEDPYDREEAEGRWSAASQALSEFEASVDEATAHRKRAYADLDAQVSSHLAAGTELDRQIGTLTDELNRLVAVEQAQRTRELEAELAELAPLVEAQREAVGATAATNLSEDYSAQADGHAKAWKRWGSMLVVSIIVAVAGGLILFREDSVPSGELTNGAVVEVTRNLVIIGLLIYLVRLTSLQFRVHRHLEAVARNKAAALSTFNRMVVVASEPEVRNSLATVLAQAVFASDETGFVDAAGDHVTLIERVAGSLPRPS